MKKRQHKRFIITLHAQVIIGDVSYEGVIGNVSEEGVSTTVTTFIKTDENFTPNNNIRLVFQLPSGETVDLSCEIRWYLKPRENGENLILGLYIVDPSPKYMEWLQKFY